MPASLSPMAASVPEILDMDLFQRMVLLTEAMNKLKQQVNKEKYMHYINPSHIEEVSSDKEEIEVPVMSVALLCLHFYCSPPWVLYFLMCYLPCLALKLFPFLNC